MPGARYHEQQRAKRELRSALHPDEHLPPPVCMRFPPQGPRIVAVVLGPRNLQRDKAAFRSLRLKAVFEVSSVGAYEAHLVGLLEKVRRAEPPGYADLRIERRNFGFTKPLQPKEEIDFEPLCPRVEVGIHANGFEVKPTPSELAWAETAVRHYGSDYVSIFYGSYGVAA
jgi:hypothetical protein